MGKLVDLAGRTMGRWTVLERAGTDCAGHVLWLCQCKCGVTKTVLGTNLTENKTKSCGCLRKEEAIKRFTTHGLTKHPLYSVWSNMLRRCNDENRPDYKNYGGRGITVCDRWQEFDHFYSDMHNTYNSKLTLERRDNNLGYSLENCYWATSFEQANNKRNSKYITIGSSTLTVHQWARKQGIKAGTIHSRLYAGWSEERAVLTPVQRT